MMQMKKKLALALLLFLGSRTAAQTTSTYVVAARTVPVTDSSGNVWHPDTGLYDSGTPSNWAPSSTVTGTPDPMLYKGARVALVTMPMTYTFKNLMAGPNVVTLYFAEPYWDAVGKRVFNVTFNGATTFSNVDIFAASGGKNVAYTLSAPITISGGTLTISFVATPGVPGNNVPMVNAFRIAPGHAATLKWSDTVNAAGTVAYNLYRASTCSGTFTKIASKVPGFTYVDQTIAIQTSYCYRITAIATTPDATEGLPCASVYVPGSISTCNCQ